MRKGTRRDVTLTKSSLAVALLVLVVVLAGAFVSAETPTAVAVRVNTPVANAPATVVVTATVERDERNRMLIITASSDGYLRRSSVPLEGQHEARVHQMWLRRLPRGEYEVLAEVLGPEERHISARTRLLVTDTR